ncbi:hypothetical protein [Mycoplasma sp. Ms02]|uniref:hypothetical protein n=1 Tax=Mycoplasma sp. Ms02 TaxID=353851 RepID=UPI001C8991AE|nr:hypothetical protein [Mycoplasma sp. Ms02]QZE12603.1 hypothetical protein K4L35_01290 [Mycoplasma sp. Ms02]
MKISSSSNVGFGVVIDVASNYILVKNKNQKVYKIEKSDLSDWRAIDPVSLFKTGDKINFVIVDEAKNDKVGKASFKLNHPNFAIGIFKHNIKETASGFKNLKASAEKEIEVMYENKNK